MTEGIDFHPRSIVVETLMTDARWAYTSDYDPNQPNNFDYEITRLISGPNERYSQSVAASLRYRRPTRAHDVMILKELQ